MSRSYQFFQLDVFTDKPFTGNPLAVFPDAIGISELQMQQIAREMNLSETVFVLPSNEPDALRRLRIFTPIKELPMAGHPVVGTWNLLARLGVIENAPRQRNGTIEIKHELGIGVLPVEIEFAGDKPKKVTMTQGKFTIGEVISDQKTISLIAESFNLSANDLLPNAPVKIAGTGVNFTIIPVRSLKALGKARANAAKLEELPKNLPGEFSLFALETIERRNSNSVENNNSLTENFTRGRLPHLVHTRMFAPEFGIVEDPATGSAAGALGGYLLYHGLLENKLDDTHSFIVEQGDFIERPSRIEVEVKGQTGNVEQVRVGGASVVVAKGEMYL